VEGACGGQEHDRLLLLPRSCQKGSGGLQEFRDQFGGIYFVHPSGGAGPPPPVTCERRPQGTVRRGRVKRGRRHSFRRVSLVPSTDRKPESILPTTRARAEDVRRQKALRCDRFYWQLQECYRIVEYHTLGAYEQDKTSPDFRSARSIKEVLNLPLKCDVEFDKRIIEVFSSQANDPRNATRHSIGRILLYNFERLERILNRIPTRRDLDRNCLLNSSLYAQVFGRWSHFEKMYKSRKA